jgi:hypothetical protein
MNKLVIVLTLLAISASANARDANQGPVPMPIDMRAISEKIPQHGTALAGTFFTYARRNLPSGWTKSPDFSSACAI